MRQERRGGQARSGDAGDEFGRHGHRAETGEGLAVLIGFSVQRLGGRHSLDRRGFDGGVFDGGGLGGHRLGDRSFGAGRFMDERLDGRLGRLFGDQALVRGRIGEGERLQRLLMPHIGRIGVMQGRIRGQSDADGLGAGQDGVQAIDDRLSGLRLDDGRRLRRRGLRRDRLGGLRLNRRRGANDLGHGLVAMQRRAHLHRLAGRHLADPVGVTLGAHHRGRDRRPAGERGQEQGLLRGATPDQGVDHDPLALKFGPAPQIEFAGRLQQGALVDPQAHGRGLEGRQADIEGEAGHGVDLVLVQRREHQVVQGEVDFGQVVEQQDLAVGLGDGHPGAGGLGVAVADGPAPVRQLGRRRAEALEPHDEVEASLGDLEARLDHGD